jgi:hypothetical protein
MVKNRLEENADKKKMMSRRDSRVLWSRGGMYFWEEHILFSDVLYHLPLETMSLLDY